MTLFLTFITWHTKSSRGSHWPALIIRTIDLNYLYSYLSLKDKNSLLPPIRPSDSGKKCLIIDLDETLVHSSFKVSDHHLTT